jgi:GTP-binding protein
VLSKVDALTPELRKQQLARLKRAAKKTPLGLSSASGEGVQEVLRALLRVIDDAAESSEPELAEAGTWHP